MRRYLLKLNYIIFPIVLSFAFLSGSAQNVIIRGIVKDVHSDERIPFASLEFVKSHAGKLTDSVGTFAFGLDNWPKDTLMVTYVGYQE